MTQERPNHLPDIGRAVNADWLTKFIGNIEELSPHGFKFVPRKNPALAYVLGEELAPNTQPCHTNPQQLEELIGDVNLISASSYEPLECHLFRIHAEKRENQSWKITAKFDDIAVAGVKGYVINNERTKLRDGLNLQERRTSVFSEDRLLNHYAKLGYLSTKQHENLYYGVLADVRLALDSAILLDPVDIIRVRKPKPSKS